VLAGRRNSPADAKAGLPPLAVYSPIHYQELPELFMDFICSLTGKSPATTGFGSEGALTKAAFNALPPVVDLNNALVSFILTGYAGFTTSAGYIGPHYRVDHDISLLVPEIWCRMRVHERDPGFSAGQWIPGKGLRFLRGRPHRAGQPPRLPDYAAFRRPVSGAAFRNAGRRIHGGDVASGEAGHRPIRGGCGCHCGSPDAGSPAVLRGWQRGGGLPSASRAAQIMAEGSSQGKGVEDTEVRRMFTREYLMASDWYCERLRAKQTRDVALWTRHLRAIEAFRDSGAGFEGVDIESRLADSRTQLARVSAPEYLSELEGTLGADPFCGATK
jgi:hypothetical protein